MSVSLIVAVSDNGVIGRDGKLPWHLPDDLKRFRSLTIGARVLMGRKTADSIGAPLARRRNIVASRRGITRRGAWVTVPSLVDAIQAYNGEDVFIIGGAEVYEAALPFCTRAYVTRVHATVEGSDLMRFPCDLSSWHVVASERHDADARHAHAFTFETLSRR